jgi:hypothetical protein
LLSPSSEQIALLVRRSSSKKLGNCLPVFTASYPRRLECRLNDWFSVVFRGYTLVVSGERRVIAIDELEKTLKWPWLIWGCYSTAFLEELTVIRTNTGWNTGA